MNPEETAMPDDPAPAPLDPVTATTAPVGVSSRQIFTVALILLALYAIAGIAVLVNGTAAERTAFLQSIIGLAGIAVGFYLGSSASSRNKDRQP